MRKLFLLLLFIPVASISQTTLQASSKLILDDGYDYTELSVTPWGGSHGIFFGAKVSYNGSDHLWSNGNAIYARDAGQYSFGAFSMGYIANGGIFSFYDGGVSTGVGNQISWNPVMSIVRGGRIGIGTNNPVYKFVLNGGICNLKASSYGIPAKGSIDNGTSAFITNTDDKYGILSGVLGNGDGWMQVQRVDGAPTIYNLNLQPNGGTVGVGCTNPTSTLTVNGDIGIQESGVKKYHLDYYNGGLNIAETNVADYRFFIKDGGNIGIGTNNPQAKLAVNGDIFSRKVKVTQTGWSDYVFRPGYKLPSLKEVEEYIKRYQHLPDIPSATEVQNNGLDLGDNQAALLKKIEELTLYIIAQDKKIESQQKQITQLLELKKDLDTIKSQLKTN